MKRTRTTTGQGPGGGDGAPSDESNTPPELVLAFAKKMVKPGGQALVIGSDNSAKGWVSLEEAVQSGESFAVALWLDAKGFKPLGAEMARDGSGVIYLFDREGIDAVLPEFHATKDKLNAMSTSARGR
jgi:hypothetical protein